MKPDEPRGRLIRKRNSEQVGAPLSVKTFVGQLAIRLTVVAAVVTAAGVTSYGATHWEPNIVNSPPVKAATR